MKKLITDVLNILYDYGQVTSGHPSKAHLLPGQKTFISASQYSSLAQSIVKKLTKGKK